MRKFLVETHGPVSLYEVELADGRVRYRIMVGKQRVGVLTDGGYPDRDIASLLAQEVADEMASWGRA